MGRRGHSTTIGKFAKIYHDRRVSEIRILGELLRHERTATHERPATAPGESRAADDARPVQPAY